MTAPQRTTQHVPVLRLDPTGADHQGEAARLRELGPVVKVILPGDVEAWAVTTHQLLTELVNDPRVSKDWHRWTDIRTNRIPEDWPLTGMVKITNMVTADGDDHRRLRRVVTQVLTPNVSGPCARASPNSPAASSRRCPSAPARTARSTCVNTWPTRCR